MSNEKVFKWKYLRSVTPVRRIYSSCTAELYKLNFQCSVVRFHLRVSWREKDCFFFASSFWKEVTIKVSQMLESIVISNGKVFHAYGIFLPFLYNVSYTYIHLKISGNRKENCVLSKNVLIFLEYWLATWLKPETEFAWTGLCQCFLSCLSLLFLPLAALPPGCVWPPLSGLAVLPLTALVWAGCFHTECGMCLL